MAQPPFTPYVPPDQAPPEFTAKAVLLGALFGLLGLMPAHVDEGFDYMIEGVHVVVVHD